MNVIAVPAPGAVRWKRWTMWAGRIVTVAPVLILLMSARWKLTANPWYAGEWVRIGYAAGALRGIGLVQIACVVLYLIPSTAVLGAVLLTGYLGGAISAYIRLGEPIPALVPLSTALLAWAGLYLREERLRTLLPFRRNAAR
jgi:hypothetical protein